MDRKRPYTHILKNLFHEQAAQLIPLLQPGCRVLDVFDVEMPELRSTEIEEPPDELEEGLVKLAVPEAKIVTAYRTEWIEHSGRFERAYHIAKPNTNDSSYLVVEIQLEREVDDLPRELLTHFVSITRYISEELTPDTEPKYEPDPKTGGTLVDRGYSLYPVVLCQFPTAVPAPFRETSHGQVLMAFNFIVVGLWEKDAREVLNTRNHAAYYLLPAMKNADAALVGLAIDELAQHFGHDESELGRHLTGLSLMLQQSEMMPEAERLVAQEHLKRFAHLIKDDPHEE